MKLRLGKRAFSLRAGRLIPWLSKRPSGDTSACRQSKYSANLASVVLGGVEHHAAPAATHIEQAHPRPQVELAADELVFVGLRLLQHVGGFVEHRARVGEARAEHEPVEGVGYVVVVADRRRVAGPAVPAAAQAGPLPGGPPPAPPAPAAPLPGPAQ